MDYFKILNLEREPFSNSPEPGLFFPSRSHVECLQMLEMAIRLRRGLNVVLGEVGTGKTTLCRKLIQQFAAAGDKDRVEVHLVLDPSFSTPGEFLNSLAGFFGLVLPDASPTERQLKEAIKAALFTKGVDEGKIVLLLVDEGQKLPDFCIEILRELLNYETNDSKLLQIVIFGQTEFEHAVQRHGNFSDRINLYCRLNPLNFMETARMIQYRIAQAGGGDKAPILFSWPAIYAVYRASGGYPRTINMLCHHVVLAMIIQNRVRAGRQLVRACAGRLALMRPARRGLKTAFAAVLLAVSLTVLALTINKSSSTGSPISSGSSSESGLPAAPVTPAKPLMTASRAATPTKIVDPRTAPEIRQQKASLQRKGAPSMLGALPADSEKSAWLNFTDIYASTDADLFRVFKQANPRIDEKSRTGAGAMATIPAIPFLSGGALIRKSCCVQIARLSILGEAYRLFKAYRQDGSAGVMLLPFWSSREGLVFVLLLKDRFSDRVAAAEAVERLPRAMRKDATIIDTWDDDTVFYRGFGDEV